MTPTRTFLCLLVAAFGAIRAAAAPFDRMYVFGDSYSDIGAGYVDGNGPTAVAYLAWKLGLAITIPQAADSAGKSIDFAVSGAQTGEGLGRMVKGALIGYGMVNQVRDFAARVQSGNITFNPDTTLFFIAGGLNDSRLPTETTLANLKGEIEVLKGLGGRHFTLAQLPTKIPSFSRVGLRLSPVYEKWVGEQGGPLGIDLWMNHWGADYDLVMDHAADYGIANTTARCAGREIFGEDAVPVGDPATYYYYHGGHPSTAVHRIVGLKLADEVASHEPR